MKSLWNKISVLGISDSLDESEARNFILSNKLNFVLFVFTLILSIVAAIFREIVDGVFSIHTKKILFLALICSLNLFLAKKHFLNIVRFNLVVFPSLLLVFLPVFWGYVQDLDFYIAPLIILALSTFPAIILKPSFKNLPYLMGFIYFLIQAFIIDILLVHFSNEELLQIEKISHFNFYFKLIFISVFVFIYLVIYYYRRTTLQYEVKLSQSNQALEESFEELKSTQAQLVQAEKIVSLGVLTSGVAHEINNPLNYIMGGYVGLSNELDENGSIKKEDAKLFLEGISLGVEKAAKIVKGLNQLNANNKENDESCEIHSILDNCLHILSSKWENRIEIQKDYCSGSPISKGNIGKLHQVFLSVLLNAIESILEKGSISLNTQCKNGIAEICIKDTGSGIPKDNLNKITDPFFTTKAPGKGTGLGLSITNTIIQDHKGKMIFKSKVNKGTSVTIQIPNSI